MVPDMTNPPAQFGATESGERLTWIRQQDGRKQREVAELVPITSSYLSQLEHGARKPPAWIVKRLADIYGCPRSLITGSASLPNDTAGAKGTEAAA
jgi:transcriptional regulator with XRE-family HTH domain